MRGPKATILTVMLGGVIALGQAPVSLPWLVFLAVPLLIWRLSGATGIRNAFMVGWLAGLGYFGLSLFWIVEPFLVDLKRHGWMAPFALTLMAGGMALFWGAATGLASRAAGPGRGLALACSLCAMEYLRGQLFTGFPWAMIAYVWMDTPLSQTLAIIGPHGLTLLTLLICAGLAMWRIVPVIVSVSATGVALVFGSYQLGLEVPLRDKPLVVRLVQPNAPQHLKWQPDMIPVFYQRQIDATGAGLPPDLVIWPETAVPFLLHERPDLQRDVATAARGAPVILGIRRRDELGWYNSLAVLGVDGEVTAQYDKSHLVPFGEYIPFAEYLAGLGIQALATGSGFQAGGGLEVVSAANVPAFVPLICYEAIFPAEVNGLAGRPEWLVQVTNDAWFGSITGPYQHLDQARARAIEQGLPLARAANTGVSAMIDPRGQITASLGLDTGGHIDADLPAALPATIYSRFGDWTAFLIWIALSAVVWLGYRNRGIDADESGC